MDIRDLFYISSNMLDEVNDAVRTGDYSRLGSSLAQMSEEMRRDAERVRQDKEKLRRQYEEQMKRNEAEYVKFREAGQNGTRAQSATAYSRPPVHTVSNAPIVTPFMQQNISRLSGLGRIVGGTAGLVISVILLVTFLVLGLALSGGWMIGAGICAAFAAYMVWQIMKGLKRRKRVNLFYRFASILGKREYFKVDELARCVGKTPDEVVADIKDMKKDGMLPQAKFDATESTVMLTQDIYRKYLDAEKSRLEREAEERRKEAALRDAGMTSEVKALLDEGESYLGMVRTANDQIPGDEMTDKLEKLEDITNRIFDQVKKDPKSAQNLRKFMNYYLPTTQKLLEAYVELDKQQEDIANVANTKREVESAMDTINEAFENLLDSLFEEVAWDVSSDISAMRAMMAQDGLTPDEIAAGKMPEEAPAKEEEAAVSQPEPAVSNGTISLSFGGAQAQAMQEEKQ